MKKIRGVVLDLEDTLFDKTDWIIPAIEHAAALFGLDQTRAAELLYTYSQRPNGLDANIYNHILLGCGQFDTAMNVRALCAWANQYQPGRGSLQLFPGTLTALETLSKITKLAIVAEGQAGTQRWIVNALGIDALIPTIVYSDEIEGVRSRRPDPRGVLSAVQQLSLQPDQALWVADNPRKDFIQVRAAGITTVRVLTGGLARLDPPSQEHAADYNISSVARLPALLEELEGGSLEPVDQTNQARITILTHERRA